MHTVRYVNEYILSMVWVFKPATYLHTSLQIMYAGQFVDEVGFMTNPVFTFSGHSPKFWRLGFVRLFHDSDIQILQIKVS